MQLTRIRQAPPPLVRLLLFLTLLAPSSNHHHCPQERNSPKFDRPCSPLPCFTAAFPTADVLAELSLSNPKISESLEPSVGDADTGGEHGTELGPLVLPSEDEGLYL
jgi:hypothetical protein